MDVTPRPDTAPSTKATEVESVATTESATPGKSRLRRIGRAVFLYAVVPYFSITLIFFVLQRKLMYRPTVATDLSVAALQLDADQIADVQIETDDGATLNGWLLTAAPSQPESETDLQTQTRLAAHLMIYFPGNAQNRHERIDDMREMTRSGFDVLIFDYRGFGDSSGSPSEANLTADARRIWKYAVDKLSDSPSNIVVFGESLGGAVTLSLWTDEGDDQFATPKPAAVILNSTFASMGETVADLYPAFPFRYLLLDKWPSSSRVSSVKSPIHIFHGTADKMISISQAKILAANAQDATLVEIPGGEHNNIPMLQLRNLLKQLRK